MGGAAVGGYLLTALPSWTGGTRASPQSVRTLTLLWVLARFGFPFAERLPLAPLLVMALGYFAALYLVLGRHLIAARVWRRLWLAGIPAWIALGDAAILTEPAGLLDVSVPPVAIVTAFAVLISVIGGRAVPAFTRSWLQQSGAACPLRDHRGLAALASVTTALGSGLILAGYQAPAGVCLLLAGFLQGFQLSGWRTLSIWRYPALLMLHLAWAWLPFGLMVLGVVMLRPDLMPQSAALHALTMGAMGSMILAIAGRAAMVRRGGKLIAGRAFAVAFALVWLAALLRVAAPFGPQDWLNPIIASAALWMFGWASYLWAYRSALKGAVPRPALSARRPEPKARH